MLALLPHARASSGPRARWQAEREGVDYWRSKTNKRLTFTRKQTASVACGLDAYT